MRGLRIAIIAAIVLATGVAATAGPFSFLIFWKSSPHRSPGKLMNPGEKAEIPGLVSQTAQQKCQNWAWAAALQTALKAQNVEIPQSYWIMRYEGGELCKDDPADLDSLTKLITGEYTLDDGRKVRLQVHAVKGAPTDMDSFILAPREGRPLIFFWKGHAYVYRGLLYDQMIASTGQRQFEVRQVELLDPFFQTVEKQETTFDRDKDDPADIDGVLDVKAVPIEGPDWLHPEKELDHPTEIFPQ